MAKEFIVAIEIGSSKITGIAGLKSKDGGITVLAVAKEDSSESIRKGVAYNLDRTTSCLKKVISKLRGSLRTEIAYAYVGIGGQSIRGIKNTVIKELPDDTVISQDMVDELMDSNRSMSYPDQEILDAITQEYKVDMQYQLDPVGVQCTHLEGNFLNILWRSSYYRNLKKCLENAQIAIADVYIAPLALADSVLTEAERRSGCVLVDLGAQTTTVSVYYKNILRHLVVIPLGAYNITKDIASLQMEEQDAEYIKRRYASAYTDTKDIDDTLKYSIDQDRSIESHELIKIVEARLDEIISNVKNQIPEEYDGRLLGGLILTGGGAELNNIEEAFRRKIEINKIRTAKFVNQPVSSNHSDITAHNGMMNTVLGLLAKGNLNCAGSEISDDLFGNINHPTAAARPSENLQKPSEISANSEPEKPVSAESDVQTKDTDVVDEEDIKRGPGTLSKFGKSLKEFISKMASEEE